MVVDLSKIYIRAFTNPDWQTNDLEFKIWKSENPSYKIWSINDWFDSKDNMAIKTVYVII